MSFQFSDSERHAVKALTEAVRHAHFRLVWVAGATSAMRSKFLEETARVLECPFLSIGRVLSSNLLEQEVSLRSVSAEEVFYDILHDGGNDLLILDHLEILFDEVLKLKAVELIKNASRRFSLVASWPGEANQMDVTYGPTDHPAHLRISLRDLECPVHYLAAS